MKFPRLLSILVLNAVSAFSAGANERFLIPIISQGIPGAYGSFWVSHLAITNHSDRPVAISGYGRCELNFCPPPPAINPDTTIYPDTYGSFLSVADNQRRDVTFQLRIQDTSRQSETWGTSIPVVGESEAFVEKTASLTDIPLTDEFRAMLRVFDFEPGTIRQVRIRFYATSPAQTTSPGQPDPLVHELVESFRLHPTDPHSRPSVIEIPLWTLSQLQSYSRIRVEVESLTSGLRFWTFATVTNNQTQHVTTITPQ